MCGVTRFEGPSFLCSSFSLLLWAALSHSLSPLPYPPVGTLPGDLFSPHAVSVSSFSPPQSAWIRCSTVGLCAG